MSHRRCIGRLGLLVAAAAGFWSLACTANDPTTQSSGPLVEALGVTSLQAQDPRALADWYTSRFRIPFQPDGGGYLSKDDTAIGSMVFAISPLPEGAKPEPISISFFVRNLDRVLGQLSDAGTSPRRIDSDSEGRPKAEVLDPEGNRIELVQR
jgi:predicted enzyme related to lactoylglutathione lyase